MALKYLIVLVVVWLVLAPRHGVLGRSPARHGDKGIDLLANAKPGLLHVSDANASREINHVPLLSFLFENMENTAFKISYSTRSTSTLQ